MQQRYGYKIAIFILLSLIFLQLFSLTSFATTTHKKKHAKQVEHAKAAKPKKLATHKVKPKTEKTPKVSKEKEEESGPLTGNFTIASNYMFRGISQTDNLPAFQGGFTYTIKQVGLYFNIWGSNVNFPDARGRDATLEIDTIVGITNHIGEHFNYNIYFNRYNYPRTNSYYNEGLLYLTYYFLTGQFCYSGNVYNTHGVGTYYNLGLKFDIPPKYFFHLDSVSLSGGFGHYSMPRNKGLRSYNDYNVQLNKSLGSYTLTLLLTDTNGRSVDEPQLRDFHAIGQVTVNF